MLIALTAFSCLKVYSCLKTENKEITQAVTQDEDVDYSKLSSSEVYTIPDQENDSEGNPTYTKIIENYDNYTYFKILGYQSIRQFGHSLSKKYDFSGKVIFLSCDISYANGLWRPIGLLESWQEDGNGAYCNCNHPSGMAAYPFRGTFDGRGFKLTLATKYVDSNSTAYTYGLFAVLDGAVVKNVRMEYTLGSKQQASLLDLNVEVINSDMVGSLMQSATYGFGAISGYAASSIIRNCVVDKLEVRANFLYKGVVPFRISGITNTCYMKGQTANQITNCYVGEVSTLLKFNETIGTELSGVICGVSCQLGDTTTKINGCVVKADFSNLKIQTESNTDDGLKIKTSYANPSDEISYHSGNQYKDNNGCFWDFIIPTNLHTNIILAKRWIRIIM